jgi:hypothetical protein
MREQAEDAVRARRELRVVPIERVARRAVHERGRGGTGPERLRSEHGSDRAQIRALHMLVEDAARVLRGTREHHAEAVDDAAFRDAQGFSGEIGDSRGLNEVDDCAGRRFGYWHRPASIAAALRIGHKTTPPASAASPREGVQRFEHPFV